MYDRNKERKLSIFSALASGLDQAAKNYQTSAINMQNLQASRYRLQKEMDGWETEKKTKELQLAKLENELDPANLALQREKLKQETNAKKAMYTLYESRSKLAESKAEQELAAAAKKKDLWEQITKGAILDPRLDVDFGGGVKYKAKGGSAREDMTTKDIMATLNVMNKNRFDPDAPKEPLQIRLEAILQERLDRKESGDYEEEEAPEGESMGSASGNSSKDDFIQMIAPDGSVAKIPKSKKAYYEKKGAKVA